MYVAGSDDVPLAGAAAQRRLLALLALLAVGGKSATSRDRIVGLLWPDTDDERARHALAQALYHARRTLACDDLFVGSADLRLNPERIWCDVWQLEEAAARHDDAAVAAAYKGAFLDGFFLAGSAEFEQWAGAQRDRYSRLAARALERLAESAERGGDPRQAVDRWRQRLALDPLDSHATVKLISALAMAGDRVGALQQARVHEALVRAELEVSPDPTVLALVQRLRTEATPRHVPAVAAEGARSAAASGTAVLDSTAAEDVPTARRSPASELAPPAVAVDPTDGLAPENEGASRSRRIRLAAGAAGVLSLAVAAVLFFTRGRTAPEPSVPSPLAQPIVVAPFRVTGADASLGFLREGMVELLAARVATDSNGHPVDPGSALVAWRRSGFTAASEPPRDSAVRVAAELGASHVVVGSAVGNPAKLILSATLLNVPAGTTEASLSVEGPVDSLTTLVDRLAVGLMAVQAGEESRLAVHTTSSPAGLRAYLEGQAAYRRGLYADAAARYEAALHQDSTFAIAALQLALASDRLNDAEQHDRALAIAWAYRNELTDRDAAYLEAFAGPRYPAPSPAGEQLAAWERAVSLAPDRPEAWKELGERYFYDGAVTGLRDWRERAVNAFSRALALDPAQGEVRPLLVLLAARADDRAELARWGSPMALRDSMGAAAEFVRWRVAVARGDSGALRRQRGELPRMRGADLRMLAMATEFDGIAPGDAEHAIRILRLARSATPAAQLDAILAEHSLALNEGRPVLALDLTEQLQDLQPGSHAHLRLRVLDAIYGDGDRGAAQRAVTELETSVASPASTVAARAIRLADACVLGQWRLATGSTRGVARVVRQLRAGGLPRVPVPIGANPHTCAELLDASLAVAERREDASAVVARVDSLMLSGPAVSDAGTYAHRIVANLYERLGEPAKALATIRRRAYMTGWPRYLATTRREEGRLALQLGDTAGALAVLSRYLTLRPQPEAALRPQVQQVREIVTRVGAGGAARDTSLDRR